MFEKVVEGGKAFFKDPFKYTRPSLTKGFKIGLEQGLSPSPFNIALMAGTAAYAFGTAPRGKAVANSIGSGLGFGVAGLIGGVLGGLVGGAAGAYIGATAGQLLFERQTNAAIARPIQALVDFDHKNRHVNFGGDYKDTNVAYTMRQVAAREMSGSLLNARQWLGHESSFLHQ